MKKPQVNKIVYSLRLDPADAKLLEQIKERDGVPASEQIRRGLRLWFGTRFGAKLKMPCAVTLANER